jgi:hypothetical protein
MKPGLKKAFYSLMILETGLELRTCLCGRQVKNYE